MKPLDPTKNPENFIEATVAGESCRTLTDGRFKIPAGSSGVVEIAAMAEMQHNALSVVHFHWRQDDKSYKRCFVPSFPIKISRDKDIEKVNKLRDEKLRRIQSEELERSKENFVPAPLPVAPAPKVAEPAAEVLKKLNLEITPMSVANIDKLVGKFLIQALDKKPDDKFEVGIVCQLPDGTMCGDSNMHTPKDFASEKAVNEFVATNGIVSSEDTTFTVLKVIKVI